MLLSDIIQYVDNFKHIDTILFSIALVLVLLSFENMTNTNTILTVEIVFQYNTSLIVHLCNSYIKKYLININKLQNQKQ